MPVRNKSPDRLIEEIVTHLEDFPRQVAALENAMQAFGEDFELKRFKPAFEGLVGIEAYNRVQAVERSFARVQNYMAQLSLSGAQLAGVELPKIREGEAARAFEALKRAGVIDPSLCRKLKRTQKTRSEVEHDYTQVKAGSLHEAVELVAASSRDFIGAYSAWIDPYLKARSPHG